MLYGSEYAPLFARKWNLDVVHVRPYFISFLLMIPEKPL